MSLFVRTVLAGEDLTETLIHSADHTTDPSTKSSVKKPAKIVLGPGIVRDPIDETIRAIKCGRLYTRDPTLYWVMSHQKEYYPMEGDRVLGTVISRGPLHVRVDIGASDLASLSLLAFEGATKKNRPEIYPGDVVLCRVAQADKDLEAELACISTGGKRDGLGLIASGSAHNASGLTHHTTEMRQKHAGQNNGFLFQLPIDSTRELLSPKNELITDLGKRLRFELTIGHNGLVWVKGSSQENTMLIVNAILTIERSNSRCEQVSFDTEVSRI